LCINPDFTSESRPVRYLAATFSNAAAGGADSGNVVVRSFVRNGVTITRSLGTIINFDGYIYNVNIPAGDDIQHMSLFDLHGGAGQASLRVVFTWNDSDFVGNISSANIIPVSPNVTSAVYVDNGGSPLVTTGNGPVRSSGGGSNEFQINGFSGKSITVDLQLQDGVSTWYVINFSF
jgi:hypothetical protein